jgi:hypothetical protein
LAKTYGQLPSYVRDNATTYDIKVMELMLSWEEQKENKAAGKPPVPQLTQEQMKAMIAQARNET